METLFEDFGNRYYTYYYGKTTDSSKTNSDTFSLFEDSDFEFIPTYETFVTEDKFLENYNNLQATVEHFRASVFITKNDNKITIKYFSYHRRRATEKKWFTKTTSVRFVTYNTLTNKGYYGKILNYHKKRKCTKTIRQISLLDTGLEIIQSHILNSFNNHQEIIDIFMKEVCGDTYDKNEPISKSLLHKIYSKRGVKLSDNFFAFYQNYPTIKSNILKKTKGKFIDAIMNVKNIKGDKMRRILHKIDFYNDEFMKTIISVFGEKFISQLPDDEIVKILNTKVMFGLLGDYDETIFINKIDKINAYLTFKDVLHYMECDEGFSPLTFFDHINFYIRLNKYERAKFESKNVIQLQNEHMDWTNRLDFYTKGTFHRLYNDEFLNEIQIPIEMYGMVYQPVVLKTSEEYNNESYNQSNCVKTYIEKASSLIISVRGETQTATIEYKIKLDYINSKIIFKRVQSLGKYNKSLDSSWNEILNELDVRMKAITKLNMFTLPSMECTFGNRTKVVKSFFSEDLGGGMSGMKTINDNTYNMVELQWESYIESELVYEEDIF